MDKSGLYKLAAEMAMCKSMPSINSQDWRFTKGMQITNWRQVFDASLKAENQCRDWAIRLKKIIDTL